MMRDRAVDAVGRWCAEHGRPPHPRLADAWDLFVQGVFAGLSPLADDVPDEDPEPGNPNDSHTASAADGVQRLLSLQPPADREQLSAAFDQISQCVAAQSNPMSFIAQMGLGLPGAEE